MLRMSWRPQSGVLVLEGQVDRYHRDVLAIAGVAAVGAVDVLLVDIDGADIDEQGREALVALARDLWVHCGARVKTSAAIEGQLPSAVA